MRSHKPYLGDGDHLAVASRDDIVKLCLAEGTVGNRWPESQRLGDDPGEEGHLWQVVVPARPALSAPTHCEFLHTHPPREPSDNVNFLSFDFFTFEHRQLGNHGTAPGTSHARHTRGRWAVRLPHAAAAREGAKEPKTLEGTHTNSDSRHVAACEGGKDLVDLLLETALEVGLPGHLEGDPRHQIRRGVVPRKEEGCRGVAVDLRVGGH